MTKSFPDDAVLRYSVLRLTNCLSRKRPVRTIPIPGLAQAPAPRGSGAGSDPPGSLGRVRAAEPAQRLLLETGKLRLDVAKQHRAAVGIRQRVERVRRRVERAMRAADVEHARGVGGLGETAVDVAGQLHTSLRAGLSQFLGSESSCPADPPARAGKAASPHFPGGPAGERGGAS